MLVKTRYNNGIPVFQIVYLKTNCGDQFFNDIPVDDIALETLLAKAFVFLLGGFTSTLLNIQTEFNSSKWKY